MAINLTKILNQVQDRINDSATTERDLDKLIKIADRINNSGVQVKTYGSTGQLPTISDSAYIGTIAYVSSDNVFGDSDGRFYYASGTDSGWRGFTTTQDSAEALIEAPSGSEPSTPVFAGTNYGYSLGGGSSPYTQNIDQYSFSSDGNATNVGAMDNPDPTAVWSGSSGGSTTHGYHIGGSPVSPFSSPIFKFPYTSGTPIADTGNDVAANQMHRYGHYEMCGDRTNIYVVGGYRGPSYPTLANKNTILSFAASSDGSTVTDYGDLTQSKRNMATQSSDTHGYSSGGYTSTGVNVIEKWPFSASGNATDVGDLTVVSNINNGHSSSTHGYSTAAPSGIEKFPFSTDGNATDVADLYQNKGSGASASSDVSGYIAGGNPSTTTIQKFSFTSDANGTLVGALAFARRANAGTHY